MLRKRRATLPMSLAKHCMCLLLRCTSRAECHLHVFFCLFNLTFLALHLFRHGKIMLPTLFKVLFFCFFVFFYPVAGILRPRGRRPMRKGRSGLGLTRQEGCRTQAASPRCLRRGRLALPLANITTPTCVSMWNNMADIQYVLLVIILLKCSC